MPPADERSATFLLTDIEGSTRLWEERREPMAGALEAHDQILKGAVEKAGGTVVKSTGDGILAAFDLPEAAAGAALDGQRALTAHEWTGTGPLRVRMAINSGSATSRGGDYHGPALNRVARLLAIGHGGQILVSGATAALVSDRLPPSAALIDRGEHQLRDISRLEHVYQLVTPDLRRDFPPLRSETVRTNLPAQLTSFIGRRRELADVGRLLETRRLVTLVGVGGTGKTRLMLQAATDDLERHLDGAWLVELAPISDPAIIVQEVGRALGVQEQPGQPPIDVLIDYLRAKHLLLLLDNCEHLIGDIADLANRLLAACPGLTILASSREPLGVPGEAIFPVPSLGLPEPLEPHVGGERLETDRLAEVGASEAVRLFVDRATATLPGFVLDDDTAAAIVEICRRLDGLPLALELAAARVNVLSVDEIARGLGDRFRLLTGGRRTAVPRQQTLQALIDWSWDLLTEPDQRLLRRLSTFAGGWTLEAAAEVTRDRPAEGPSGGPAPDAATAALETLDGLSRLVDRSLVVVDHDGATRYRMLETIRQFARDRLVGAGEAPEFRTRHLTLFAGLARDAETGLSGPDEVRWLERLDPEVDNLRAALEWAFESDAEAALRMSISMLEYGRSRSVGSEALDRLAHAVEVAESLPEPAPEERTQRSILVARVLASAAMASATWGRQQMAPVWAERALALARATDDPVALLDALNAQSLAIVFGGVERDPIENGEEVVALAERNGEWARIAFTAIGLMLYYATSDVGMADRWLERATDAARRSGNPSAIAFTALGRGRLTSYRGGIDEARPSFAEALARYREIGDRRFQLVARSDLAHALRRAGELGEAEVEYRAAIHEWQHVGNRGAIANQLENIGFLARAQGDGVRAARLLGAAEALRGVAGAKMLSIERGEYETEVGLLRGLLDPATMERAWADGRALNAEEAVALALTN